MALHSYSLSYLSNSFIYFAKQKGARTGFKARPILALELLLASI